MRSPVRTGMRDGVGWHFCIRSAGDDDERRSGGGLVRSSMTRSSIGGT
jgi:hypothetical protein